MRRTGITEILIVTLLVRAIQMGSLGTVGLTDRRAEYEPDREGYQEGLRYARAAGDALNRGSAAGDAKMRSFEEEPRQSTGEIHLGG